MTTKTEKEMAESQRTAAEHASRQEAAATGEQALASARAASVAATGAEGLPGLHHADRRQLVAALRAGASWADATAALTAGRDPKLTPTAAVLERWRTTIAAEAAA